LARDGVDAKRWRRLRWRRPRRRWAAIAAEEVEAGRRRMQRGLREEEEGAGQGPEENGKRGRSR